MTIITDTTYDCYTGYTINTQSASQRDITPALSPSGGSSGHPGGGRPSPLTPPLPPLPPSFSALAVALSSSRALQLEPSHPPSRLTLTLTLTLNLTLTRARERAVIGRAACRL